MMLSRLEKILNAELHGGDVDFERVSIDGRSLQPGDLYIALKGERFDGHDFIEQAKQAGACAAIVSQLSELDLPQLKVDDTRQALAELAAEKRQQFQGKLIAVTGSNGKTTVKEMLACILGSKGKVLATQGNFNNDIGLPLTLLRLQADDEYAVIEMGANHPGEIFQLSNIAQPDVALITNAGPAHLEGFGSLKGVARAKGEIFSGLFIQGTGIINGDDIFADDWQAMCKGKNTLVFGLKNQQADVKGEYQPTQTGAQLEVQYQQQQAQCQLPVPGEHNVMNALAAITASLAVGLSLQEACKALEAFAPVAGRLNMHRLENGACVIDDSYNANPASLEAGLKVLKQLPGRHWLVLGDMGELGENTEALHFDAGVKASEAGVDKLLAVGEHSKAAVKAFGEQGRHFASQLALIDYCRQFIAKDLNLLIKGSRTMKMERVVDALIHPGAPCS